MNMFSKYLRSSFYKPGVLSFLFNPSFFIRSMLYLHLKKISKQYISGGLLIDYGCGTQPYKNMFRIDKYYGVEKGVSLKPIDLKLNDEIIYYDEDTMSFFPSEYADYIFSSEVFELIDKPDLVLQDLYRILKPGGLLIITIPFVWQEHFKPYDHARYTLDGFIRITERNGYEVKFKTKSGNYAITLYQLFTFGLFRMFSSIALVKFLYPLVFQPVLNLLGLIILISSQIFQNQRRDPSFYLNSIIVCKKKNSLTSSFHDYNKKID